MPGYTEFSEEELLDKLSGGDQKAFDEIYKRHWSSMYRAGRRILKDHDAVMDVLQEVFIWIWKNHEQLSIRSLKPYLHAAVKFKVANYIRDGKIRSSLFEEIENIEEPGALSENSLEVKELQQVIADFTKTLPEKCRQVFLMSRQDQLSNKEIAKELGISVKTVENQMTTALKKLRLSLARMFYFLFL